MRSFFIKYFSLEESGDEIGNHLGWQNLRGGKIVGKFIFLAINCWLKYKINSNEKKTFSYQVEDEPRKSSKSIFIAIFLIGRSITSIEDYFQLEKINSIFGFFFNVQNLVNEKSENIFESCLR